MQVNEFVLAQVNPVQHKEIDKSFAVGEGQGVFGIKKVLEGVCTKIACVELENNFFMGGCINRSMMQVHKVRGIRIDLICIKSKPMFEKFNAEKVSKEFLWGKRMIDRVRDVRVDLW